MLAQVKEYFLDLFELIYPNICVTCQRKLLKGEDVICITCDSELPLTEYWRDTENPVSKRLWGRVEIQGAASFLEFRKGGKVQRLVHQLKYKGRQDIGTYLGRSLAFYLSQKDSVIKDVDLVVPVPLHWKKMKQRGYNQSTPFAKAIAEYLKVPFSETALERQYENVSQTRKKRYDRWGNVEGIFSVADEPQLMNKHILVVDDVFTTGATAEACLQTILRVPGSKVSFLSIALSM